MRPGRFPLDHPDERRARAKLTEKPKRKDVVKIKIPFSYNGKGKK